MRKTLLALACLVFIHAVAAAEPFRVSDIRVQGLQRISAGTVFNYLPVQVGEQLDGDRVAEAIRALYDTGFFQDVTLRRDGDVLVVDVVERPAVARIALNGNDEIADENLLEGLRDVGLAEGRVFNRSLLAAIERELQQQYFALGYYDVRIESTVSPLPRNRVGVRIDVREGEPASVQEIQFVGNETFDDETLRDQFALGPRAWWAVFSSSDKYSRQKLGGDLEALRSFYQDQGFINFAITSTQVSISPDRQRIHITVNLAEGEQYRVGEVKLAGELIYPEEAYQDALKIQSGDLYSRRQISETSTAIRDKLGERGYAFANVNPVPEVDEEAQRVDLTLFVDPAERVYVRRINVSGNERTRDEVIRRELTQLEGGWLSTQEVKQSREALNRLGFFEDVTIETPRAPGTNDQVDVNVSVAERLSGSLQAGIGYGTDQGVVLNFGVEQDNVLGSGDKLGFTANNNRINTIYRLSYLDRFYTVNGIDRRYSLAFRDTDAEEAELSDYGVKSITATYGYEIPLDANDSLGIDFEYEDLTLDLSDEPTARQRDFVERKGERNQIPRVGLSWIRDTRDRAIFPSSGSRQELSTEVAVPGTDLEYYRVNYEHSLYFGLTDTFTLLLEGGLGYGDGYGDTTRLPFFENYFAGGITSVRGFRSNSLGRRDENDDPIGGNFRALGTVELRFPPPGSDSNSIRLAPFVDFGQVWDTLEEDIDPSNLRYSAGLAFIWYSPLGPLTMSVAQPLNDGAEDETQIFQFSLGTFF